MEIVELNVDIARSDVPRGTAPHREPQSLPPSDRDGRERSRESRSMTLRTSSGDFSHASWRGSILVSISLVKSTSQRTLLPSKLLFQQAIRDLPEKLAGSILAPSMLPGSRRARGPRQSLKFGSTKRAGWGQ